MFQGITGTAMAAIEVVPVEAASLGTSGWLVAAGVWLIIAAFIRGANR